ncbi:class C sortase [uncultured Dubosiella sp.]|jgi:sortase A|uniref:class C sortase n=2 Tax=uncultured Dubosiella sp. TaxID=1937011 RepID=UPI000ECB25C1|nr:class C sortase [uncultured Dubosiella sp.]GJM59281.1 class C sortase [Erysipelotrichaceae bacterium OPF54]HAM30303.1 hypothetical protein [Erysipelotrichaceae bacterium]
MKNKLLLCFGLLCAFYPLVCQTVNGVLMKNTLSTFAARSVPVQDEQKELRKRYNETFDSSVYEQIEAAGIMARISIPVIGLDLPVYAGCGEEVLGKGIGHWPESHVPYGGDGTRTILTGHRGLAGHGFFTRLDELKKGDRIMLDGSNGELWYEVSEVRTMLPQQAQALEAVARKDMLTLITCTPYGINSHRLVVDAVRCGAPQEQKEVQRMPSVRHMVMSGLPFGVLLFGMSIWKGKRKCGKK